SVYGWICSTVVAIDLDKMKGCCILLAVSTFFLPALIILVMYALVFVAVHKRRKMLRNGELGQTCNDQNQRSAFLQDLKAIRMLLVVVGVFILCWGPILIYILLVPYYPNLIGS
ncbi:D(5)-like dopamine receptor, partial [Paramuricea clavata]